MKPSTTLLVFLMLLACQEKNEQVELSKSKPEQVLNIKSELESIEKTRAQFTTAVKEGDRERLRTMVTSDAKTIGPDSQDWRTMYETTASKGPFPYDSIVMFPKETIIVSDSIAYDFGFSHVYYTNTEGEVTQLKDSFLAILKKGEDGIWRLHREVATSKVPD